MARTGLALMIGLGRDSRWSCSNSSFTSLSSASCWVVLEMHQGILSSGESLNSFTLHTTDFIFSQTIPFVLGAHFLNLIGNNRVSSLQYMGYELEAMRENRAFYLEIKLPQTIPVGSQPTFSPEMSLRLCGTTRFNRGQMFDYEFNRFFLNVSSRYGDGAK